MDKTAQISVCGRYRYWLGRQWSRDQKWMPLIMLNPSTADADNDDPTIRRCISFARREGFGGIGVLNLFAFRATSPMDMKSADDPVGPDNDYYSRWLMSHAHAADMSVLAAWGAHGSHLGRDTYVRGLAKMYGARLVTLGTTKDGHPRHPLYVRGDQPLVAL